MIDDEAEKAAARQTAAYAHTVNWLGHTTEMSEAELDAAGIRANEIGVYGHDAKRDRHGNWIEQGIGSKGHETGNHFQAIRRYQGEKAWADAIREIWARDPTHAQKLRLPKPPPERAA